MSSAAHPAHRSPAADQDSSARRGLAPAGLAVLALLLSAVSACGPAEPVEPPRFAVVERPVDFELVDEQSASRRYSRAFQPGADETWTFEDRSVQSSDGQILSAESHRPLDLAGPLDGSVNAALQHVLRVRLKVQGAAGTLHLWWRKKSESWDSARSSAPIPFEFNGEWQEVLFGLASMRGRKDSDVSEGVDQFRIRLSPADQSTPLSVQVDEIELLSDFDLRPDQLQRIKHHGTNAHGRVIPRDASLSCEITPGPRDRLRFALAAGGAPVQVSVRDAEGKLPPLEISVDPDDEWREFKLDLSPLEGAPSKLIWSASSEGPRQSLALLGAVLRLAPEAEAAPNLLMYLEDTLRADHLGTYGYPFETDPALRAIADEGVVMLRTYSASSWTRPATSTLLSSLNPTRHGNRTHLNRLPDAADTIAETLGAAGWVTRSFVTNYHGGQWAGLDQGFDLAADAEAHGASHVKTSLTSEVVARPLEEFLREHADERVFVHVHTLDPHSPYDAPAKLRSPFQRRRRERAEFSGADAEEKMTDAVNYDAEILYNDKRIARLDRLLGDLGQREDTLFVFLSDHGEAWQEHGQWSHRQTLFQEEIHVPWILRWPAGLPAGVRLEAPVGLVDVAPTLLGLLGQHAPPAWQGRDLSTWMRGERESAPRSGEPLLIDLVYERQLGEKIGELAVVQGELKMHFEQFSGGSLEPLALYDLSADPGERENLLAEPIHARAVEAMTSWAAATLSADRAANMDTTSAPMDEAQREALAELGYVHEDAQH
ncbi:MAG: hypothetical protein DHS20C15_11550 [Planctomycetota bacterium]|nr:MAG: hypothetical protein DHS20C15_11550 [Planctomycetota bacterium]